MNGAEERFEQILELAQRLEDRKSDLQAAAAADAGFPVSITGMEVDLAVSHLRTMEEEIPWIENGRPYGVVAAIFPYDGHAVMLARLGGAALITGNRLRFSFSSQTPRLAGVMAEICKSVRALDPVVAMNNREFGDQCVKDHAVRVLFMSGGSEVGQAYRGRREAFDKLFFAGPGRNACSGCFSGRRGRKSKPLHCAPRLRQWRPVLHHPQEGPHSQVPIRCST
jgi:acyl-CoA reductase-like NAD-dependent aldehyde dehydrogenase